MEAVRALSMNIYVTWRHIAENCSPQKNPRQDDIKMYLRGTSSDVGTKRLEIPSNLEWPGSLIKMLPRSLC
jgi:hypothetical protein